MRLHYFRGEHGVRNFGDELNPYLWPKLLPGAFDDDAGIQFVGIGTLLNDRLPEARRTIVFGSGVGYYGPPRRSSTWTIYCVRGPLSARALGLDADAAVTDPGALIARFTEPRAANLKVRPTEALKVPPTAALKVSPAGATGTRWQYAFMPHWQSEPEAWKDVAVRAGCGFIDPRGTPEAVVAALQQTDVLITEAMHGAIVADALRIPWVPVRTRDRINSFKWDDWCASLKLEYHPQQLPTIWPAAMDASLASRVRRAAKLELAARALRRVAARSTPLLSRPEVLDARLEELETRLDRLRRSEASRLAPLEIA